MVSDIIFALSAVDAINSSPQLSLKFPWDDEKELMKLERGFASLSKGKVRGCLFSLDGFCVRIHCPRGVVNPRDYYHRKGFYAFVVQAVVDAVGAEAVQTNAQVQQSVTTSTLELTLHLQGR